MIDIISNLLPLVTALAFVGACVVVFLRIRKNPDFFIVPEEDWKPSKQRIMEKAKRRDYRNYKRTYGGEK